MFYVYADSKNPVAIVDTLNLAVQILLKHQYEIPGETQLELDNFVPSHNKLFNSVFDSKEYYIMEYSNSFAPPNKYGLACGYLSKNNGFLNLEDPIYKQWIEILETYANSESSSDENVVKIMIKTIKYLRSGQNLSYDGYVNQIAEGFGNSNEAIEFVRNNEFMKTHFNHMLEKFNKITC